MGRKRPTMGPIGRFSTAVPPTPHFHSVARRPATAHEQGATNPKTARITGAHTAQLGGGCRDRPGLDRWSADPQRGWPVVEAPVLTLTATRGGRPAGRSAFRTSWAALSTGTFSTLLI